MVSIKKLILVTAKFHPLHKVFTRITDILAERLNVEKEVKYEDYIFLAKYGEKDEFGMAGTPQLLVEFDDGRILPVLTQGNLPLTAALKPDIDKAIEQVISTINSIIKGS